MPFTPFHFGPAAIVKGLAGHRFSFMVFGGSQVLMDIEPGVRMFIGTPMLHGPTHTLGGAIVIGLVSTLIGKPIGEFALNIAKYPDPHITWFAAAFAGFFGTLSHIFLDAVMHSDMVPWSPLASSNPLLGVVSLASLHAMCLVSGLVGGLLVFVRFQSRVDSEQSGIVRDGRP